ncbi:MAG: hypothetical protein R3B13_11415 [Polyangiaceae bacterium]
MDLSRWVGAVALGACCSLMACGSDDSSGGGSGGAAGSATGGSGGATGGAAGSAGNAGAAASAGSTGKTVACSGLPAEATMVDSGGTNIKIASLIFSDPVSGGATCEVKSDDVKPSLVQFWNDIDSSKLLIELNGSGPVLQTSHGTMDNGGAIPTVLDLPADTDVTVRFEDIGGGLATGYFDVVFQISSTDKAMVKSASFTATM